MKIILTALGIGVLLAAMVASSHGYKLYGRATVIDNRTLTKKTSIIAMFEKPNLVITEGGDRIAIEDFELSDHALQLSFKEISSSLSQPDYVHVVANASFPSGYAIEVRNRYAAEILFFRGGCLSVIPDIGWRIWVRC